MALPLQNIGKKEKVSSAGPGYYRIRKLDGGFDYYKGDNFKVSVDDLSRETGLNRNELTNPDKKFNTNTGVPSATSGNIAQPPTVKPTAAKPAGPSAQEIARQAEAAAASQYAAYLQQQEQKKQAALNMLDQYMGSYDNTNAFADGTFDEAGARTRAEGEFNPFYEDKIKRAKEWNDLERRDSTEDWARTTDVLKAKKEKEGVTFATAENSLLNTLGDSGTARSGVGMRQWALGRVQNTFNNEDITRDETANTQVKDLNLDKINNAEGTQITDFNRAKSTDIANRTQWEKTDWQAGEDKRYTDWQSSKESRISAYKRSLGLT